MSSETAAGAKGPAAAIGFNLGAIVVALALCGLALAYVLDSASRHNRAGTFQARPEATVIRTLAGKEFAIPLAWIRYDEQKVDGFADQIDLRFTLALGVNGDAEAIDIALIPRSRARPSAGLLDGVYLHQFMPNELSGPPGLVGKPLYGNEGFENETVWYDALSVDPFVAKCIAPVAGAGAARCLRTVLFDEVAAVYAFNADVLSNWRRFDPDVETLLAKVGITR